MSDDVETFGRVYFDPKSTQDRLYAALEPARQRFVELAPAEGRDFRGQLTDYVRLYVFPLSGAEIRGPRPRKALRLRPTPPAPAAGQP